MRVDRALTLALFGPLRQMLGRGDTETCIPILMYHSISRDLDEELHPYFRTVTSPQTFARHVKFLREEGYAAITLTQAVARLAGFGGPDGTQVRPAVVLTFDDGFRDFHTEAFPILQEAGFAATVFLATAFIGRDFITGRPCLNSGEVKFLAERGIEFGSHSMSHRRLVTLSTNDLRAELLDSKSAIESITGHAPTTFSFPFRFPEQDTRFTRTLGGLMDECGFHCGVTTCIGRARRQDDRRFLPRLPMNDCDDTKLLRAKLSGHYDWLRSGQRLRKRSRGLWPSRARA